MAFSIFRKPALAATTLALAGAALTGLVTAGPAQASTSPQACQVSGGLGGSYICEYGESWQTYPNGQRQVFVVGTNREVWTRYNAPEGGWSNWQSMGGKARSKVEISGNKTWNPTVAVTGMDGNYWYRQRMNNGGWTGWQK
ncbi:hypothetical protein ACFWAR_00975 [Streptomyces sp. NPDC059917]|uniref:hypothetical protein n=1 Tax=Streptomyces sp. NPDC059917 TaxID=3347002 RepID=UPI00365C10E6